jgi:hypothetical protein
MRMDFDIGNILYVVITLVAVVIGLLGKKKKPSSTGKGQASGDFRGGFMENLERIMNAAQEEPRMDTIEHFETDLPDEGSLPDTFEPVAVPVMAADQPQTFLQEYQAILDRMGARGLESIMFEGERSTKPIEVIEIDQEEGTDYLGIIQDFDAGAAVVYSAIINRIDY